MWHVYLVGSLNKSTHVPLYRGEIFLLNHVKKYNSYKPGILFVEHRQTV